MQIKRDQYSLLFILLLLVTLSLFPLIIAHRYPIYLNDDAYITLTYIKNLVNGNGFVFNHPPAVLGTTTPLFTLVIAGLALLLQNINIPVIVVFFSALCWIGTIWIFYVFRSEWGLANWQVAVLALVIIGAGWVSLLEMETYLFIFLLLLSLSFYLKKRYWLTGFTVGLLFLTRGEGILVLGVLLVTILIDTYAAQKTFDKELLWKCLRLVLGFALPVALWAAFAYTTFGSFFPNTLAAKQAQGKTGLWHTFLQRLISDWAPSWGKSFSIRLLPKIYINFWWLFILIGLIDTVFRKRKWLMLLGWMVSYIIGYSLLKVSGYSWYQLPIIFVLNLLFALGIVRTIEILKRAIKEQKLSLAISLLITLVLITVLSKPTVKSALAFRGDSRGESYLALSQWFRDNANPSESIAYIEIGYIGYYTNNRIIDLAGLVLPNANRHIANRDFAWSFWHYEPDYYIYLSDFDWALEKIKSDPRFDRSYQPVATLKGPHTTDFVIYKRTG